MNTFGRLFSFTSFGESRGPGIGVVVDGVPGGLPLAEADLQPWLDLRRPGGANATRRREKDIVRILSGVHEGRCTGAPVALLVDNTDARPGDYANIAAAFRPGHADWTWQRKFGHRDPRGGGRTSARETVARVAAGAVARLVLRRLFPEPGFVLTGALTRMGPVACRPGPWNPDAIRANPFFAPDPEAAAAMEELLNGVRAAGSSVGGVVEIRAAGVPPGLGEPAYDRLDARLAAACMGVNAVKGVEIGDGFAAAAARGGDNNDPMLPPPAPGGEPGFAANHAGGILGGISTGQEIVARCALKPTPSVAAPQQTVDADGKSCIITVSGRHDPCVAIRAVPVLEAMVACVLADFALLARARRPVDS